MNHPSWTLPAQRRLAIIASLALVLVLPQARAAFADDKADAEQLVERAQFTLHNVACDGSMGAFRDLMKKAQGVLIFPDYLKGAFVVGASGGSGVLLIRDKKSEKWTGPAFYTMGGASVGLQAGGESSDVILLAMTERGVKALQDNSVKLGADVGIAAGPVGMGASAATENLSVDILSFSRSKGLYGGISLDGAVVAVRDSLNSAYYGGKVSTSNIFGGHTAMNRQGRALAEAVAASSHGMTGKCGGSEKGG